MSSSQSKHRTRAQTHLQETSMSSVKATLLLICFWAIVWGVVSCILLFVFGKLPPQILGIASAIQGLILLVVAVFGTIGKTAQRLFRKIWENGRPLFSTL